MRKPQRDIPRSRLISTTVGIILLGFLLGVLQKWLDSTASNHLPELFTAYLEEMFRRTLRETEQLIPEKLLLLLER